MQLAVRHDTSGIHKHLIRHARGMPDDLELMRVLLYPVIIVAPGDKKTRPRPAQARSGGCNQLGIKEVSLQDIYLLTPDISSDAKYIADGWTRPEVAISEIYDRHGHLQAALKLVGCEHSDSAVEMRGGQISSETQSMRFCARQSQLINQK
jgi:hypothetical protein